MEIPSKEDLLENILGKIQKESDIKNVGKGSVTRLVSESISNQIQELYSFASNACDNLSLSKASGSYLDDKGALLDCQRNAIDESDENYRTRISNQPAILARENLSDINYTLLSVPGIKNIKIDEYVAGGGSFAVYILTDEVVMPESIKAKAEDIIYSHKSLGTMGYVLSPIIESCYISLIVKSATISLNNLKELIKNYIKDKIEEVVFGSTFNFEDLANEIKIKFGLEDCKINYVKINEDYIYNYSFYKSGDYSRMILDDIGVENIE